MHSLEPRRPLGDGPSEMRTVAPVIPAANAMSLPVVGVAKAASAGSAVSPKQADDERDPLPPTLSIAGIVLEAPPWLFSAALHMIVVIVLALLFVAPQRKEEILLSFESNEDLGDDFSDSVLEMPLGLTEHEIDAALPPQHLPEIEIQLLEIEDSRPLLSGMDLFDPTGRSGAAALDAGLASDLGDAMARSAHTSVFGLAAEGQRFVYVFDQSESMTSTFNLQSEGESVFSITLLAAAKAELLRSLGDLNRNQQFHILFYNDEVSMFDSGANPNRLVEASQQYKYRATEFVRSVYGYGNTYHVEPLEVALRLRPDVIFLLTDGEAKDDPTGAQLKHLRQLNRRLNGGRTKINVIQFCLTPRSGSMLVRLARQNNGSHIFMDIRQLARELAVTSG